MNKNIITDTGNLIIKAAKDIKPPKFAKNPKFWVGAGIVGFAATAVVTGIQSTKLKDITEDGWMDLEINRIDNTAGTKEYKTGKFKAYSKMTARIIVLYTPSVVLGMASAGCIMKAYNVLNDNYISAVAAMAMIDENYRRYRKTVVETYGEDADWKIMNQIKDGKKTEVGEDGKKKKVKVDVVQDNYNFDYSVKFNGDTAPSVYNKHNATYNEDFIRITENYANNILNINGFVFLNDVLDWLGLPKTSAGAYTGWLSPDYYGDLAKGDGYVQFTTHMVYSEDGSDNELDPTIIIDFNVDGVIADKIDMKVKK